MESYRRVATSPKYPPNFPRLGILSAAAAGLAGEDKIGQGEAGVVDMSELNGGSEFYTAGVPDTGGGGKPRSKVSPSGSNASSISFCRICHEGEREEHLVAPCECAGTTALIHRTCLEHWLTSSNSDKCEICKHQYNTTREPRSCVEYIQDSSNQFNVRNLIADTVCFFLLTPLLVVSTYLCILGAEQYYLRERWEAVGLIVLSLFLIAVYLTWCHVTIKFHFTVWLNWQRTNQRVRLVEIVDNHCRSKTSADAEIVAIGLTPPLTFCSVDLSCGDSTIPPEIPHARSECDGDSLQSACDTSRIIV